MSLDPAQLEAVLERLGFARPPEPDRAGLAALYAARRERIPFDNVRMRLHVAACDAGPLPGDAPHEFFEARLRWGPGGTCWAGKGVIGVGLGQRAEIAPDGACTIRPFEPGERTRFLVEELGIAESLAAALPPDEPLPPPPRA